MTDQNSKLIKYLIGLIILALPSYLVRFSIFGIPMTILEIAIYLVFTFYFLLFIFRKAKFYLPDRRWLWPIGLFIMGALLGVLISPDKRLAFGQFKGFIFDPMLFGWIVYSALSEKIISHKFVLNSLVFGGLMAAFSAALPLVDASGRRLGIFGFEPMASANYLALFLAPIFILAVGEPRKTIIHRLAALFMIFAIFATASRGAFFGILLGLWWLFSSRLKPLLRFAVPVVIAVALIFWTKPDLSAPPASGRISTSNNIRYEIWKTTAEIITENSRNFLFGVGLGNYQNYFTELTKDRVNYPEFIAPRALTPHNLFLAWWTNGGLLMLISGVWLAVLVFKKPGFLPGQAAFVALLGHGLVDAPYFKNDLAMLFWLLIVLVLSVESPLEKR